MTAAAILVSMLSGLSGSDIVIVVVSIIFSMAIHEAMHGFVAHWLGDDTAQLAGRLTLNPLKHIDLYTTVLLPIVMIAAGVPPLMAARPVPFNPNRVRWDEYGAALVGVAGPLTNFALAALGGLLLHFFAGGLSNEAAQALLLFTEVNVSFFVFNMIPFPPLDGSRLLYAFAPEPVQRIMARIENAGFGVLLGVMLIILLFFGSIYTSIVTHVLELLTGSY